LTVADSGIEACRNTKDSEWSAKFELLKVEVLLILDRADDARPFLESAARTASQNPQLVSRLLMDQAELEWQSDRPEEARKLLVQARDRASLSAQPVLAQIDLRLGRLLYALDNNFDGADAAFRRALKLATEQHDQYLVANASLDLGQLRLQQFRYDEALPFFDAADRTSRDGSYKLLHERCLGDLGVCYFRLGDLDRALSSYSDAARLAATIRMTDDQQLWLGDVGSLYYARADYSKAIFYYSQALDIDRRVGKSVNGTWWMNNVARAYVDQRKWDEAEKYNRLALGAKPSAEVAPYLQLNAGLIATARGRASEAEAAFQTAIELGQKTHQPNVEWQAHSGLAELYAPQKRAAAQKEYAAAVGVLDHEWLALSRDDSKITFRSYQTSFYQDYVGFLSEQGQKERALEVAESSRARLLMQKLDGRTSVLPAFHTVDAIRLARETGSVLLSYWLAPNRSYVWAVTAKGISQFVLPAESVINALIGQHRRSIENLEDPLASGGAAGRQLYKTLLGSVKPLLKQAGRVIIVPDGRLHEINFETLIAEEPASHYWIEDATVALAPSLGVLRSQPAQPAHTPRLLIIGDPLPADPEFPPLPHLKTEIREIAAGFAESNRAVYARADAYPERLREADPRTFTAIHFAAHASANEESPLNSAIILSRHGDTYKLYASDVAGLHLDLELVTISACRSAGAKAYSGEGLIGFSWAFLNGGAHNVVAGIWNVDDSAAPLLMKEFYQEWRGGRDPAGALRGAKLQLMHSGGAFRKPYYWGAFEVFTRQAKRSAMDLAWRNNSK
jgi:CHAT domain-containing protein